MLWDNLLKRQLIISNLILRPFSSNYQETNELQVFSEVELKGTIWLSFIFYFELYYFLIKCLVTQCNQHRGMRIIGLNEPFKSIIEHNSILFKLIDYKLWFSIVCFEKWKQCLQICEDSRQKNYELLFFLSMQLKHRILYYLVFHTEDLRQVSTMTILRHQFVRTKKKYGMRYCHRINLPLLWNSNSRS